MQRHFITNVNISRPDIIVDFCGRLFEMRTFEGGVSILTGISVKFTPWGQLTKKSLCHWWRIDIAIKRTNDDSVHWLCMSICFTIPLYSRALSKCSSVHYDTVYRTALIETEHKSEFTLTGEPWGVYCEGLGGNKQRYNCTTVHLVHGTGSFACM